MGDMLCANQFETINAMLIMFYSELVGFLLANICNLDQSICRKSNQIQQHFISVKATSSLS